MQSICHFACLPIITFHPAPPTWGLLTHLAPVCPADSLLWKLFYVAGCLFVAVQNMEEWEEAVFDKGSRRIELKTFSLYALILTLWRRGHEIGNAARVCVCARACVCACVCVPRR